MPELTLESLAALVAELERELAALKGKSPFVIPPSRDWRSVVGMFEGSEFMQHVDAEIAAMRAVEAKALEEGIEK